MFKVMIVDDEVLIRIGLKSSIDWENNGFLIVGEAQNGAEALELYEKFTPEIVITDIRMPIMNGLDLIKSLKERNSKVKVIVLSYFNDFEYVREAMRLGAMDYILKMTMEPNDLLNLLIKVKEKIIEEIEQESRLEDMKGKFQLSMGLLEEKLVKNLVKGTFTSEDEIKDNLRMLNVDFPMASLIVLYLQLDDYTIRTRQYSDREREFLGRSILNLIKEVMRENQPAFAGTINENEFVCILGFRDGENNIKLNSTVIAILNRIKISLQKFTNFTVTIGVSNTCTKILQTPECFIQARKASAHKLFKGKNSTIFYDEVRKEFSRTPVKWSPSSVENSLRSYLAKANLDAIKTLYESIFNDILRPSSSVEFANTICNELFLTLKRTVTAVGKDFYALIKQKDFTYSTINEAETLEERHKWLLAVTEYAFSNERVWRLYQYSTVIQKAIEYMYNNYSSNIKLKDVAEYVSICSSYLSQLFKSETGENFIDYLNRIRIEKAKELMLNTDLKVYEITAMVGLENARYFSQVFKKFENITPAEFRASHTGVLGEPVHEIAAL